MGTAFAFAWGTFACGVIAAVSGGMRTKDFLQSVYGTAHATGIRVGEHDAGGHDEIGRDHLALPDVLATLQLAAGGQSPE